MSRNKNRILKISVAGFSILVFFSSLLSAQDYAIGADLSFLKSAEDNGFSFMENNEARPGLSIFSEHGYNWIRLRLFHTPTSLPNNL
jgi:arabinogalactan endo-1,4-beta-galactosidase